MDPKVNEVRQFYDVDPQKEWERLEEHPAEFAITTQYLQRYIRPGQSVLDLGGGPGRYSLYLARMGCRVTLLDLAPNNVAFALARAKEQGLALEGLSGDACGADSLLAGQAFDHVLLMGPLYHLLQKQQRARAAQAALGLLKPGGLLFASFISLNAGMIFGLREAPELIHDPEEAAYLSCLRSRKTYEGPAFTQACFHAVGEIVPFFEQFALEKLHLVGQEGMLTPFEEKLRGQPEETVRAWIALALTLCEEPELLAYSEHILYIGRKN